MGNAASTVQGRLFEQIVTNPNDFAAYLVLADWYEDNGDPAAAGCWRWLGTHSKRPWYVNPERDWYWLKKDSVQDPSSDMPRSLLNASPEHLKRLKDDGEDWGYPYTRHDGLMEAYEFVLEVWRNAIANGWQPPA
jgi:uncharacterized protein (TIGR02996 family)